MTSQFASATARCSTLLVLLVVACDTGSGAEPGSTLDAGLTDAADDAALDAPELRDAHAAIDYFATEPLCESEVETRPYGGVGICSLQVPTLDASSVDFAKVNMILRVGGARVQLFQHVDDALACGTRQAWHYDDASNPARLLLCPEACSVASSDPDTQIQIVLGCDTRR